MEHDLYEDTVCLYTTSGLSVIEISRATGLQPRWLYKLIGREFSDPGVRKVQRLNAYLRARAVLAAPGAKPQAA